MPAAVRHQEAHQLYQLRPRQKRCLSTGIVGMPNVGKSTLFNALTGSEDARAENFPFCTIEPNHGHATVADARLDKLHAMSSSARCIPARLEFIDIAGLVAGASKGEGLGNQFLANIRACDSIVHLVRGFEDDNVTHVAGRVDPVADAELIHLELCLADMAQVERRIPRARKRAEAAELTALDKVRAALDAGRGAREAELDEAEHTALRQLQLLTLKPVIYAINVAESELGPAQNGQHEVARAMFDKARDEGSGAVVVSAQIEAELAGLGDEAERDAFLADLGVQDPSAVGLRRIVRESYSLLGLQTFFTTGEQETKAWTIPVGATAPRAAQAIHGDLEKGFIRADTIGWEDLIRHGSMSKARAAGELRSEGREYVVQDGDVMVFRSRT